MATPNIAEELNDAYRELNSARMELAKYYGWHFARAPVKSEMLDKEAEMLRARRKYDQLKAAMGAKEPA